MTSLFRLSFSVMATVLLVSSPMTVTIPFCRGLTEVAGHQRDSRASIVGLKRCLFARRLMIGSRDAAGPRVKERFETRPGSEVRAPVGRGRYWPLRGIGASVTGFSGNDPSLSASEGHLG